MIPLAWNSACHSSAKINLVRPDLNFSEIFFYQKNEFLSHKIYVRYLKIRKIMDNCVIKKKKVARSLFSPPMRLPCCLHRQCYNERNARHALAYKAPNRGTDAFGCTVPCNGVFSRCLAIRFYRLEKKSLRKRLPTRLFRTDRHAFYIRYRCICSLVCLCGRHRVVLRCYSRRGTDTLL